MNDASDPAASLSQEEAEAHLARLNAKVAKMRAVLVQLLQEVVVAEALADHGEAALLVKANEQLVISALGSQMDADSAHGALDEVSRAVGLDPLTGLPNRTVLLDRLERAISHARRNGNRVALLFLDIDAFKAINDTHGHASGDRALQMVADCLRSLVRENDTVSRHGGDEFLVLLSEVTSAKDVVTIAEKVNPALASVSEKESEPFRLSVSIGISVYPDDGSDAKALIDLADAAMYRAKNQKRGQPGHAAPSSPNAELPADADQSSQRPRSGQAPVASEHGQKESDLRAANESLILAALGAQDLLAAAEEVRHRQVELLAMIADELSNPYAPIRLAASSLGIAGAGATLLPRVQSIIEEQTERLARMVREALAGGSAAASSPETAPRGPRR